MRSPADSPVDIRDHTPRQLRWVIVGAAIGGPLLLAGGGYWLYRSYAFVSASVVTEGEVVGVETVRATSPGDDDTYAPTFRFETEGGRTVTASPAGSSSAWRYAEGSRVEIRYDPEDPTRVRPVGFLSDWGPPLILTGVGLAWSVIGVGAGVVLVRRSGR